MQLNGSVYNSGDTVDPGYYVIVAKDSNSCLSLSSYFSVSTAQEGLSLFSCEYIIYCFLCTVVSVNVIPTAPVCAYSSTGSFSFTGIGGSHTGYKFSVSVYLIS